MRIVEGTLRTWLYQYGYLDGDDGRTYRVPLTVTKCGVRKVPGLRLKILVAEKVIEEVSTAELVEGVRDRYRRRQRSAVARSAIEPARTHNNSRRTFATAL